MCPRSPVWRAAAQGDEVERSFSGTSEEGPRAEELGLLQEFGGGGSWQRVEAERIWIGGAATDWMGMDPEEGDECGGG